MNMLTLFQPHLRLVYVFCSGFIISTVSHIPTLIGLNVAIFGGLFIALISHQKSISDYCRYWLKLNLFSLFIWLALSWKLGPQGLQMNSSGIGLALLITLRFNLILALTRLLLIDMNESRLLQALSRLPLPAKLLQLFILTIRYIAVLAEVHKTMDMAMRARGYQAKFNRRTLFLIANRVALLLIHALVKAEKTEMALKARGFQLQEVRNEANPNERS